MKRKVPLCTPGELDALLRDEKGSLHLPADDYNEVLPGLLIGSKRIATNKTVLKEMGITHVLNAAEGKGFMRVDTSEEYYKHLDITYFGLACSDDETTKIAEYFDTASDFIDNALTSGGKILVNCMKGFSRSSTLVIAYFMIKKGMTAQNATSFVRSKRKIGPNSNFLEQLCQLNYKLQNPQQNNSTV